MHESLLPARATPLVPSALSVPNANAVHVAWCGSPNLEMFVRLAMPDLRELWLEPFSLSAVRPCATLNIQLVRTPPTARHWADPQKWPLSPPLYRVMFYAVPRGQQNARRIASR